jgi:hypothetical protein
LFLPSANEFLFAKVEEEKQKQGSFIFSFPTVAPSLFNFSLFVAPYSQKFHAFLYFIIISHVSTHFHSHTDALII